MRVLVTGCCGYVGSNVCYKLLCAGYDVVGLDNLSNSSGRATWQLMSLTGKKIKFVQGDIRHRYCLAMALDGVEAVFHMAGLKSVEQSMEEPDLYFRNNVHGTEVLVEEMVSRNIKKMIFSSSCSVYGEAESLPMTEDTPINYQSPYAESKWRCEQMFDRFGLDAINLRYFCPIGSHESGMLSDRGKQVRNIMPLLLSVASGARDAFDIFGDDYDTRDGTCIRDYLHISDVADSHLLAVGLEGTHCINIGSGEGYSVYEMIDAVQRVTEIAIPHRIKPRRVGDVSALYADASKAKKLMGWTPTLSIDDAIDDAWKFYGKNH